MSQSVAPRVADIVGGAVTVRRSAAADWYVLQIDLPGQVSGLHELFALQLVVARPGPDDPPLPAGPGGDTAHIRFGPAELRVRYAPAYLSAYVVLGKWHEVDKDADPLGLTVNGLFDVTRVEYLDSDTSQPWLVRGTLRSGSVRLTDPEAALAYSPGLLRKLWPAPAQSDPAPKEVVEAFLLAGSQFQLQVKKTDPRTPPRELRRRVQFQQVARDGTGRVIGVSWRHVAARAEQVPASDPWVFTNPADHIRAVIAGARQALTEAGLETAEAPAEPAVLIFVYEQASGWAADEFLRPGFTVVFPQGTRWTPGTLFVTGQRSYRLTDHDEVAAFQRTGRASPKPDDPVAPVEPSAVFLWPDLHSLDPTLPPSFVGTTPGRDFDQPEVWHLARPVPDTSGTAYDDAPVTWVRYRPLPPALLPRVADATAPRTGPLSRPLTVTVTRGWEVELNLHPDAADQVPLPTPTRLLCLIDGSTVELRFYAADVVVRSPEVRLYDRPLPDPDSVPNERDLTAEQHGTFAARRLTFRTGPGAEPGGLTAEWKGGRFRLSTVKTATGAGGDAVALFPPARRALVDPVSVTRGNLIGMTVLRLAVHRIDRITLEETLPVDPPDPSRPPRTVFRFAADPGGQDRVGMYARLTTADGTVSILARILAASAADRTLTLAGAHEPPAQAGYALALGPARLAVPRDPNHGLLTLNLGRFELLTDTDPPAVRFDAEKLQGSEVSSVLALFPWGEWGPKPRRWPETGRVRLHHRNLVQEHAEFESSFEDRFPPEGPRPDPDTGLPQSPLVPFDDFIRAARDRYTEASGNLIAGTPEATTLRNWLPGADLTTAATGEAVTSKLKFTEGAGSDFPAVEVAWEADGAAVPELGQRLRVDKPGHPDDRNWLEYDATPLRLDVGSAPEVAIAPPGRPTAAGRRLVNSGAPLLFDRADNTALGYAALSDADAGPYAILVGRPGGSASLVGRDQTLHDLHPSPAACGTLIRDGGRAVAIVGHADGTVRAYSFDGATVTPVTPLGEEVAMGLPTAVAAACDGVGLAVAFTDGARLFVARLEGDVWLTEEVTGLAARVTAVALDLGPPAAGRPVHLGVGYQSGLAARWEKDTSGKWQSSAPLGEISDPADSTPPVTAIAVEVVPEQTPTRVWVARGEPVVNGWGPFLGDRTSLAHEGPITAVAVAHATNLDDRTDRADEQAGSFLVTGGRGGSIAVWSVPATDDREPAVERRTTANGPVIQVAADRLPAEYRADRTRRPFRVAAGTAAGEVPVWDARSLDELPGPTRAAVTHSLDNLGVVRALPPDSAGARTPWTVERLHLPRPDGRPVELLSVTATGIVLARSRLPEADGPFVGRTDLRFSCDGLKVQQARGDDGRPIADVWYPLPGEWPRAACDPGAYGFYSEVTAGPDSGLELLDHWPRLFGMPLFVTRLTALELADDKPSRIEFEAVLVNPDELAAGTDLGSEGFDVPGLVYRAVGRGAVMRVSVALTGDLADPARITSSPASRIDWLFGTDRQQQLADPERGFSGRLARLAADVRLEDVNGAPAVTLTRIRGASQALVLGRLWEVNRAPGRLVGTGRFVLKKGVVKQTQFGFRERPRRTRAPLVESPLLRGGPTTVRWDARSGDARGTNGRDPTVQFLSVTSEAVGVHHRATGLVEREFLPPEPGDRAADAAMLTRNETTFYLLGWVDEGGKPVVELRSDAVEDTLPPLEGTAGEPRVAFADGDQAYAVAVFTGGTDYRVYFAAVVGDDWVQTDPQPSPPTHLAAAALGGKPVAVTADGPRVRVWRPAAADPQATLDEIGLQQPTVGLAAVGLPMVDGRGGQMFVARADTLGAVTVWKVEPDFAAEVVARLPAAEAVAHVALAVEGGRVVLVTATDRQLRVWEVRPRTTVPRRAATFTTRAPVRAVAALAAPAGLRILAGTRADGAADGTVAVWASATRMLRFSSAPGSAPEFRLGIEFQGDTMPGGYSLRAELTPARQVRVWLYDAATRTTHPAAARLELGPYRCFTVDPTAPAADRGREALVVWVEGDLTGDAGTGSPRLASILLRHEAEPARDVTIQEGVTLRGPVVALEAFASRFPDGEKLERLRHRAEARFARATAESWQLSLLLFGEATALDPAPWAAGVAGVLHYRQEGADGVMDLQGPVRFEAVLAAGGLTLLPDADPNWCEKVEPLPVDRPPVVSFTGDWAAFSSREASPPGDQNDPDRDLGFVKIAFEAEGATVPLTLEVLPADAVPLDRNLEAGCVRPVPRQPAGTLQVIHHVGAGAHYRYGLDEAGRLGSGRGTKLPPVAGQFMLRPAVKRGGRVALLEEPEWLVPSQDTPPLLRTESLVVVFRPATQVNRFLTVVENRTVPAEEVDDLGEGSTRYRQLLLKTGVVGVPVVRRVGGPFGADFQFVRSPFFVRLGEDVRETRDARPPRLVLSVPALGPPGVDYRAVGPAEVRRWRPARLPVRYRPVDPADDPYRDSGCAPERAVRFRRVMPLVPTFCATRTPHLQFGEATAFREMDGTHHVPDRGRVEPADPAGRTGSLRRERTFLPGTLDLRYAADKPGAVFHQWLQVQIADRSKSAVDRAWQMESRVDFALREPQQKKLDGCVTARVELSELTGFAPPQTDNLRPLTVVWDEVVGAAEIGPLVDEAADGPWLTVSGAGRLRVVRPRQRHGDDGLAEPLRVFVQFNDELLAVLPAEPAVPAYEVEYRGLTPQEQDGPRKFEYLPPRLFIATRLDDPRAPRVVAGPSGDLTVITADPFVVEITSARRPSGEEISGNDFDNFELPDGTVLDLSGFASVEPTARLDGWRTVRVAPHRYRLFRAAGLAEDKLLNAGTWPTHARSTPAHLTGDSGHDLDPGDTVDVTFTDTSTRRYHVLTPTPNSIALLTADTLAEVADAAEGNWTVVQSRAKPYVQAARQGNVRLAVEGVAVYLADARGLVEKDQYVRIHPGQGPELSEAVGDWMLFGYADGKLYLHAPSFGVADPIRNTGTVDGRDIAAVSNDAPMVVETKDPHGFTMTDNGTPVTVTGVEGNVSANGSWAIRIVDETHFELFHPRLQARLPAAAAEFPASRLFPLDAVTATPVVDPSTGRPYPGLYALLAGLDLGWEAGQRPLFQVSWAGRVDVPAGPAARFGAGEFADLYDPAKQFKFLSPSQLAAKLGFVVVIGHRAPTDAEPFALHRTVLFGDAAPTDAGTGRLVYSSGIPTLFEFVVPDNRERVIVATPPVTAMPEDPSATVYLLKYMTTGTVVYDEKRDLPLE